MSKSSSPLLPIAVGSLAVCALLSHALAEPIDPSLPQRLSVGSPAGAAPMARVDSARSGRATSALPRRPKVLWRARTMGSARGPVAVDARGAVVVASAGGTLSQLQPDGKPGWSLRTGDGAPVTGPVILSGGRRVVITSSAELFSVRPDGKDARLVPLPVTRSRVFRAPLPTASGGLAVAAGDTLLLLDAGGNVQTRATLPEQASTLLARPADFVVVGERGNVYAWQPPALPRKLASFAGKVEGGAALSSPRVLTAVVDERRIVDLDLSTDTRHLRLDGSERLEGPPALLKNGETRVTTWDGLLEGHAKDGQETLRVPLEPLGNIADAGVPSSIAAASPSPPPLVDAVGRTAFARPGLDIGVVGADGHVESARGASCPDPVALAPAGPKRLVLVCSTGHVWMLGE